MYTIDGHTYAELSFFLNCGLFFFKLRSVPYIKFKVYDGCPHPSKRALNDETVPLINGGRFCKIALPVPTYLICSENSLIFCEIFFFEI